MSRRVSVAAGLALLWLGAFGAAPGQADFRNVHLGARPLGMSGAFSAVADDANAVVYNPAGLTAVKGLEALAMYGKLYPGLTDESDLYEGAVAVVYPAADYGTVGVGWNSLGLSGSYQENIFRLSYAHRVPEAWAAAAGGPALARLSLGLNANIFMVNLTENDYTRLTSSLVRTSQTGFGLDVGLMAEVTAGLRAALTLKNILEPDLALTRNDADPVLLAVTGGVSYAWPQLERLLSTLEASYQGGDTSLRVGLEKYFWQDTFGARAGFEYGLGGNDRDLSGLSVGLSYQLNTPANRLGLDYAFIYPINRGIMGTLGNHWLSLSARW